MRLTSKRAYDEIKDKELLSKRRFQVYDTLFRFGPLTGEEVAIIVERDFGRWCRSESIRNRITECRDAGVVMEIGTRRTEKGKTVILWDVTDNLPIKKRRKTVAERVAEYDRKIAALKRKRDLLLATLKKEKTDKLSVEELDKQLEFMSLQ